MRIPHNAILLRHLFRALSKYVHSILNAQHCAKDAAERLGPIATADLLSPWVAEQTQHAKQSKVCLFRAVSNSLT